MISSSVRAAGPFVGAGAAATYPFSFKVFQASDVVVTQTNNVSLVQTTLGLSVDYTVTLNTDQNVAPGGSITTLAAVPSGFLVNITSSVAATQALSLTNSGGFYPRNIEDALDRLTILLQQVNLGVAQAVRVPESTGIPALPAAAGRAGLYLSFDSNGNPILVSGSGTFVSTVSVSGTGTFGGTVSAPTVSAPSFIAKLATSASQAGFELQNQGGTRMLDMLAWGSASTPSYGMTAGSVGLNTPAGTPFTLGAGDQVLAYLDPTTHALGLGNAFAPTASRGLVQLQGSATGGINLGNVNNTYANALDWYEEGNWTPAFLVGNLTTDSSYSARSGTYTRIGNLLFFNMTVQINAKGVLTGSLSFDGLPYACLAGTFPVSFRGSGLNQTSPNWMYAWCSNGTKVFLSTQSVAGGVTAIDTAFSSGSSFSVSGCIPVA